MKHLLAKLAPLTVLSLIGLTGCMDHASLEGAACPCADGYVCCDGVCKTSCGGGEDSATNGNESTDNDSTDNGGTDNGSGNHGDVALPCDIFEEAGSPCVAAHSTVRALRAGYDGPLYQLCRGTAEPGPNSCKGESMDIGTIAGGYANGAAHAAFCAGQACTITKVYDQAAHAAGPPNDLEPAPPGGAKSTPGKPVNAMALPVTINGRDLYGMLFVPGMGYRAGCEGCATPIGTDLATGDTPQTIYMITSTHDTMNGCCFDYGNAETTCNNDYNGAAEAIYFGKGVIWGTGTGEGPWVMADLEDGLYAGWENFNDQVISTNTSVEYDFVTAVMVGDTADKNAGKGRFALYAGDAQSGTLGEMYDGIRPEKTGYVPMQKQGSLILSIGGDNSDGDGGRFYEAAIVNTPLDKNALDTLQAAIVAARYGKPNGGGNNDGDTDSDPGVETDSGTDSPADTDIDTNGDCASVIPCGGDVVGIWDVTSSCLSVSGEVDLYSIGLDELCDATITGSLGVIGSWAADADGTYSDSTTTTGTATLELSADCRSISGTTTQCSTLSRPITTIGYTSVECTDNAQTGGCTCLVIIDQPGGLGVALSHPELSGTYTVDDNTITITSDEQAYAYCIQGTAMSLTPVGSAAMGTITGTVELQRQ